MQWKQPSYFLGGLVSDTNIIHTSEMSKATHLHWTQDNDIVGNIRVGKFARMLQWRGNLRSLCGSCNSLKPSPHKSSRYVSATSELHHAANAPCYSPWQHPVMPIDGTSLAVSTIIHHPSCWIVGIIHHLLSWGIPSKDKYFLHFWAQHFSVLQPSHCLGPNSFVCATSLISM